MVNSLEAMLNPSSVALIGASMRPNSYGLALLNMLTKGGFKGKIYPVNKNYVSNQKNISFYPSILDIPSKPDHTVIAVSSSRVESTLYEAILAGSKSLTIFADTSNQSIHNRIKSIADEAEVEICGPNSMGFHNLDKKVRISPFQFPLNLIPGNISIILQSGSVLGALLNNDRRLRYNIIVSSGSESKTTASEFLHWSINQPSTKVAGLFLEAIRNPEGFISALKLASFKKIPVVILKVGKTEESSKLALSHTGALVGNYEVFKAVVEENGGHLVDTIDEMAACLQVFSQYNEVSSIGGIASIHDSGGERELMVDLAKQTSVPYALISRETKKKISKVLEPTMKPENPLDAWGSGHKADEIFEKSFIYLLEDKSVSLGLYVMDWRQDYYLHLMHEKVLYKLLPKIKKPVIAVSNYSLTNDHELALRFYKHGIPLVKGTKEALIAINKLLKNKKFIPVIKNFNFKNIRKDFWVKFLKNKKEISVLDSFRILYDYGIKSPAMNEVFSISEAKDFVKKTNFPIVLKTSNINIFHKSEVNGVFTNINSYRQLTFFFKDIRNRLGKGVYISEMIENGIEISLGLINDIDFGPAIVVSAGGKLIELLDDKIVFPAPVSIKLVKSKINNLKIAKLFHGYRGEKKLDINLLCKTISQFSYLCWDFRNIIHEIDINPISFSNKGVFALDTLIILKK